MDRRSFLALPFAGLLAKHTPQTTLDAFCVSCDEEWNIGGYLRLYAGERPRDTTSCPGQPLATIKLTEPPRINVH